MFTLRNLFSGRNAGLEVSGQPGFEALEPRLLLSAVFNAVTGALILEGTAKSDRIVISAGEAAGQVVVTGVDGVTDGTVYAGVNSIVINALAGNDRVTVGAGILDTLSAVIGVTVDGGTGNDRLYGGDGADVLRGGTGNDWVYGGGGADTILGEAGNDRLYGDAGADTLDGGRGNDRLYGGADDDTLNGGTGNDALFGDAGDDTLNGETGNDRLYGGGGLDTNLDPSDALSD